jgi:hypothetical protein
MLAAEEITWDPAIVTSGGSKTSKCQVDIHTTVRLGERERTRVPVCEWQDI